MDNPHTPLELDLTDKIMDALLDRGVFDGLADDLDVMREIETEMADIIRIGIEEYTEMLRLMNIGG